MKSTRLRADLPGYCWLPGNDAAFSAWCPRFPKGSKECGLLSVFAKRLMAPELLKFASVIMAAFTLDLKLDCLNLFWHRVQMPTKQIIDIVLHCRRFSKILMCAPVKWLVVNSKDRMARWPKTIRWTKNYIGKIQPWTWCCVKRECVSVLCPITPRQLRHDDSSRVPIGARDLWRPDWSRRNVGALIGQSAWKLLACARAGGNYVPLENNAA